MVDFVYDVAARHFRDDKIAPQRLPAEVQAGVDVEVGSREEDGQQSFFDDLVLGENEGGNVFQRVRSAAEDDDVFADRRETVEERLDVHFVERTYDAHGGEVFHALRCGTEFFPVSGEGIGVVEGHEAHFAGLEDEEGDDDGVDFDGAVLYAFGGHGARDDGGREGPGYFPGEAEDARGVREVGENRDEDAPVFFGRLFAKPANAGVNVLGVSDDVGELLHGISSHKTGYDQGLHDEDSDAFIIPYILKNLQLGRARRGIIFAALVIFSENGIIR